VGTAEALAEAERVVGCVEEGPRRPFQPPLTFCFDLIRGLVERHSHRHNHKRKRGLGWI